MWSGPRNISTALMRSFENRDDTAVLDEPFYAINLLRIIPYTNSKQMVLNILIETYKILDKWK